MAQGEPRGSREPAAGAAPGEAAPGEAAPGEAAPGEAEAGEAGRGLPEQFELHPSLAPLRFLLGRWEGAGVVGYPTIESVNFGQEMTFGHNGKPFLSYASRTWLIEPDGTLGRPLATETGYWRPQENGAVELLLAHPTGIIEIYLGEVTGTKIELATDAVVRTATAKEVTAGRRLYGLIGADLGWVYEMAAVGQPLQSHVSAQLKRVA